MLHRTQSSRNVSVTIQRYVRHAGSCSNSWSILQACAALEKQLKFASDRLERADEEKKELQEAPHSLSSWQR